MSRKRNVLEQLKREFYTPHQVVKLMVEIVLYGAPTLVNLARWRAQTLCAGAGVAHSRRLRRLELR
jgi:type I restriction-modification system DNA methylase subunit